MLKLIIFVILQLVRSIFMIAGGAAVNSMAERPFQVALNIDYVPFFSALCHCGGTIISARFVLTAAHCLRNSSNPNHYRVRVGTLKSVWWGSIYKVESLHIHPHHTFTPMRNDIALLKLKENLEFGKSVQPALLAGINDSKPVPLIVYASG